jgi:hypothetical protein
VTASNKRFKPTRSRSARHARLLARGLSATRSAEPGEGLLLGNSNGLSRSIAVRVGGLVVVLLVWVLMYKPEGGAAIAPLLMVPALAPLFWVIIAGRGMGASAPEPLDAAAAVFPKSRAAGLSPFIASALIGGTCMTVAAGLSGISGAGLFFVSMVGLALEVALAVLVCEPMLNMKRAVWAYKAFVSDSGGDPEAVYRKTTLNVMLLMWPAFWTPEARASEEAWATTRDLIVRAATAPQPEVAALFRAAAAAEPAFPESR